MLGSKIEHTFGIKHVSLTNSNNPGSKNASFKTIIFEETTKRLLNSYKYINAHLVIYSARLDENNQHKHTVINIYSIFSTFPKARLVQHSCIGAQTEMVEVLQHFLFVFN